MKIYNYNSTTKQLTPLSTDGSNAIITDTNGVVGQAGLPSDTQTMMDYAAGGVQTLIGADTNKSARTIAAEEVAEQLVPENAGESLDTLQEIAAWIQSHPGDAASMNQRITSLETAVPFTLYIQNGVYGYKDASNTFIPFKSQADIDAAVSAAKVGTATAADVLAGKTFTNSTTSGVTGTMPSKSLGTAATGSGIDSTGPYVYMPYGYWPEYSGKAGSSYTYMTAAQAVNACPKQEKTVTAGTSAASVTPDSGKLLSKVTYNPTPSQEKSCTPSTSAQTVSPDSGKLLSKVTVNAIPNLHTLNSMIVPRWGTGPGSNVPATQVATRNPRVDFGNSTTYGNAEMIEIAMPAGYYAWSYGNSSLCIPTETKTVTAGTSNSTVSPTEYNTASKYVKFLKSVTVKPTPTQEKTTKPTTRSSTAATITPDSGKHLSKVTIDTTAVPNSNSGDYTCGSNNGAASSNDMGATNTYKRVNATNVASYGGRHCNWFGTSWGQMSWGTEKTANFTITASGVTNGESYLIRTNTYVTAVTGCTVRGGALNSMQQPTILVKATSTTITATIFANSTWKCRTAEILTFGCDPGNI